MILGLAVSGGADSMALAYLCRQLELSSERSATGESFSVTGFVVDHRAREESRREASTVAKWLSKMGMYGHLFKRSIRETSVTPRGSSNID